MSYNPSEAWASTRPIFSRLPGNNGGYSDLELSDWLTKFWDDIHLDIKTKIQDIPKKQLHPLMCDPEWLDGLALLSGFTEGYWDKSWAESSKRQLIAAAFSFIWERKGSVACLRFILNALEITNQILEADEFIIGTDKVGDVIGRIPWDYTIVLPIEYKGTKKEQLTQQINEKFGAAVCTSRIVFEQRQFPDEPIVVPGLHPDTLAYRDRVVALGDTIDLAILQMLDIHLVRPLIASGLREKIGFITPVCSNAFSVAARVSIWGINESSYHGNISQSDYSPYGGLRLKPTSHLTVGVSENCRQFYNATYFIYGDELTPVLEGSSELRYLFGGYKTLSEVGLIRGYARLIGWMHGTATTGAFLERPRTLAVNDEIDGPDFSFGLTSLATNKLSYMTKGTLKVGLRIIRDPGVYHEITTVAINGTCDQSGFIFPGSRTSFRLKCFVIAQGLTDAEMNLLHRITDNFNKAIGR